MKPLEEHLAAYLLSLQRGPWLKAYCRECVAIWRETYGDKVASKVEKLVRERWHKD